MDFIFELILDLFLEGGMEVVSNKKISRFIRYPILTIIILFFLVVIFGIMYLGIVLLNDSLLGGLFFIIISLLLLVACIYKFRQVYVNEYEKFKNKDF